MIDRAAVETAGALIERAIRERLFPATVAEVGSAEAVLWRQAFGRLTFEESSTAARESSIFDLASLTKPVVTTTLLMQANAGGALDIGDPVATFFSDWRGVDRDAATVQDLLEHCAGLSARLLDSAPAVRREFEYEICTMRLEYAPRTRSIYSDLGFVLLGFIAEDLERETLATQFDRIFDKLLSHESAGAETNANVDRLLTFDAARFPADNVAPTRPEAADPRRGRTLVGEIHDDYAAALGGIAGHAGLFGNAPGLGVFARAVLGAARGNDGLPSPFLPVLVTRFARRSTVPGSSRALGWDTMLPTSSCGTKMSPAAFGHVGFTGTSLWIDPVGNRYYILLTNRACGGGSIDEMRTLRRAFHDSLAGA